MVQERPGHYSLSLLFRVSPSFYVLAVVKVQGYITRTSYLMLEYSCAASY